MIDNPIALIDTSKGLMKLVLFNDKMPITSHNFIRLANDGFYDRLVFRR